MTRDDIIRLAEKAGLVDWTLHGRLESKWEALEQFAALVAAAELEACAEVCDERASKAPMGSDEQCEAEDCAYAIRKRRESK
jgi:hypothetical protein